MAGVKTCDFTGELIEPGTGTILARNDGVVLHFRSSKARKNYEMGRDPQDLGWISKNESTADGFELPHESMNEIINSILDCLDEGGGPEVSENTLEKEGLELCERVSQGELDQPSPDHIHAMLAVIPVLPSSQQHFLIQTIQDFAEDFPEDIPTSTIEGAGKYDWLDVYRDVHEFILSKERVYSELEKDGMPNVDSLKRKQLQVYLGDRLQYINPHL